MRKFTLLFISVLVMLSMLLSACGTPSAPSAPRLGSAPGATKEPGATNVPGIAPNTTESAASYPNEASYPNPEPLTGTIGISGAFALYPMMTVWTEKFTELNPGVQFDVQAGGEGKGMTDALAGLVEIGMVSREIKAEETAQGAVWVSVTKDAVFPIVSANNPVLAEIVAKGISPEMFKKIFITGEVKTWGEVVGKPEIKDKISVYTRSDSSGAAEMWVKFCGGMTQDDIQSIGLNGEPAMVDAVIKDPLGIGYSNLNSVFDLNSGEIIPGAAVAPIDSNKNGLADADEYFKNRNAAVKAVSSGKYPSPPARFENLVTKGQPTGLTKAFIQWILTSGQKYLSEAGYVRLTPEQRAEFLEKIK